MKKAAVIHGTKHDARTREAYHEAGHAVARVLLDLPFVAVSIERKTKTGFQLENGRKTPMQYVYTDGISWTAAYTEAVNADILAGKLDLREALAVMAGLSAEARLLGRIDATAQQGAQDDLQQITVPCRAALSLGKPIERWTPTEIEGAIVGAAGVEALRLVEAHWAQVEAVAVALLQRERLTRVQATRIVQGRGAGKLADHSAMKQLSRMSGPVP